MHKLFSFICASLLLSILSAFGQSISNVTGTQKGDMAIVTYDLNGDQSSDYFVSLFYSTDGGKTFSNRLSEVSGDVNTNVSPGVNKRITWDAKKEINFLNGEVIFKVEAEEKESMPPPSTTAIGSLFVISAKQSGTTLFVEYAFIQTTAEESAEFYISDPPKIILPSGIQVTPMKGMFGIEPLNSSQETRRVDCVRDVPIRGNLSFQISEKAKVIKSLSIPIKLSFGESSIFVVKDIPVQ